MSSKNAQNSRKRTRTSDLSEANGDSHVEPSVKRVKTVDHDSNAEHLAAHHRHFFHVEAPIEWNGKGTSVFLAGGISNCADWQAVVAEEIAHNCPELVLLNPRRKNFDMSDHSESERQIKWEYEHLRKSSAILFWFPKETLCPITLFELGQWSALAKMQGKRLFVGTHPEYQRKMDVEIQLSLICPEVNVVDSLPSLCAQVKEWYQMTNPVAPEGCSIQ